MMFSKCVRHLTSNDTKVLLTFDGYRSHISFRVLEHFRVNNDVFYALPAHSSVKLQTCDVVIFDVFKLEMNNTLTIIVSESEMNSIDVYQLCRIIRHAPYFALSYQNIKSSFESCGLWPIDRMKLMPVPRSQDNNDT